MMIRHKILLGFAALVLIGVGYGLFALSSLHAIAEKVNTVATQPLSAVEHARAAGTAFRDARDIARESLAYTDFVEPWDTLFDFERKFAEFQGELDFLKRTALSMGGSELERVLQTSDEWHRAMLVLLGDAPATAVRPEYQMRALEKAIELHLDSLVAATITAAEELQRNIAERAEFTEKLAGIALGLSLLLALVFAGWIALRTVQPLRKLEAAMTRVANNDFDAEFETVDSRNELGAMSRALQTFRDNAVERLRAEEDLRIEQERYKSLTEIGSDWNWECDADERFTFVSRGFERTIGISRDGVVGQSRRELAKRLDGDWDTHFSDIDARRAFRDFRYTVTRPDGSKRYVSVSGSPVFDEKGQFQGYRGTGSDRTAETEVTLTLERQRQELEGLNTKLTTERERLNLIYRHTPAMLHSILPDGTLVEVSDYWCEKMGYDRHEVVSRPIYDFMTPESMAFMRRDNAPKLFEGVGVDNVDYTYVRKDGSTMDVRLSAIVAKGTYTADLQTFSVVFDVSDQKKAERELEAHRDHLQDLVDEATVSLKRKADELRQSLEKEKELNTLQREFVSMASHEFRTPLAIIDGSAQRIERRAQTHPLTTDDLLPRIAKIRKSVERMTRLMESTLSAARMEEGAIEVKIEHCDIGGLVQDGRCASAGTHARSFDPCPYVRSSSEDRG